MSYSATYMYTIVYYVADPAGRNMAQHLAEELLCRRRIQLHGLEGYVSEAYECEAMSAVLISSSIDVLYMEFLEFFNRVALHVVLSRHSSAKGKPSLTTHVSGNPMPVAEAGGNPLELGYSHPIFMWLTLRKLFEAKLKGLIGEEYSVTYEVTHHGPTALSRPIAFVEIGSDEQHWNDKTAAEVVARAVSESLETINSGKTPECTPTIGFGGPHYAPLFTSRALKHDECFGHMIPSYAIEALNDVQLKQVVKQAVEKNAAKPKRAVVEKMKSELKKKLLSELSSFNLEIVHY